MIDGLSLTVALTGGVAVGMAKHSWDNRDITKLKRTWKDTLLKCNVQGIRIKTGDKTYQTFILTAVRRIENGYKAHSLVPRGLDYNALESAISVLESNLNAKVTVDKDIYCKWINITIINKRPEIKFKKIECSSDYFFGGYKLNGKPNLIDLNCDSHIVVLGRTRTGKSVAMFMGLTNLFANAKKHSNFKVYFLQTKKRDLCMFENCKNVQKVGKTLNDCEKILRSIIKELESRADIVEKYSCKDINEYNRLNPKKAIPRLIIVGEEFSFFKEDDADSKEDKELKAACEKMILEIVKTGGGYNVNLISALQRPTVDNLNTTVRSQLSVITFKLKSENDSKIAIQGKGAEKLNVKEREAIFDGNTGTENIIYPKLSQDFKELREIVPAIKQPVAIADITNEPIKNNNSILSYEETQELKNRAKKEYLHVNEEYKQLLIDNAPTKYQGKFADEIDKFLNDFGVITVADAKLIFSKNNANRILTDYSTHNNTPINQNDILRNNGKVYYKPNTTPTLHKVLIAEYYCKFKSLNCVEIISYNTAPILKDNSFTTQSKTRKPDLEIIYKKDGRLNKLYIEVDDTHETDDTKLVDYSSLYKKEQFQLIILKEDVKKSQILHKETMKYKVINWKSMDTLP